jgi:hypothetical protein
LTLLGIDSLMAVELKNRVEFDLQTQIPLIALIQGGTIAKVARTIVAAVDNTDPARSPLCTPAPSLLEQLDSDQAQTLLAQLDQFPATTINMWIRTVTESERNS